jgi:ABC-type transport system substrate-binding protein
VPLSTSEASSAFAQGRSPAWVGTIVGRYHPHQSLTLNVFRPGTPPPELVEMADEAKTLADIDEANAAYQEISRYLVENPIHVPIAQWMSTIVCRPNIVGCETMPDIGWIELQKVGVAAT